jgi:hypothetical protein
MRRRRWPSVCSGEVESLRKNLSRAHQEVRQRERSRGVPNSGCRVTSFHRNRRITAAAEVGAADSGEKLCGLAASRVREEKGEKERGPRAFYRRRQGRS